MRAPGRGISALRIGAPTRKLQKHAENLQNGNFFPNKSICVTWHYIEQFILYTPSTLLYNMRVQTYIEIAVKPVPWVALKSYAGIERKVAMSGLAPSSMWTPVMSPNHSLQDFLRGLDA